MGSTEERNVWLIGVESKENLSFSEPETPELHGAKLRRAPGTDPDPARRGLYFIPEPSLAGQRPEAPEISGAAGRPEHPE